MEWNGKVKRRAVTLYLAHTVGISYRFGPSFGIWLLARQARRYVRCVCWPSLNPTHARTTVPWLVD